VALKKQKKEKLDFLPRVGENIDTTLICPLNVKLNAASLA